MINKVVAFGCSFVRGDSMGHRFRYAPYTEKPLAIYYLGKEFGLDRDMCDIRAHGGHSNQYIYRKFYNYIADVKNQKSLEITLKQTRLNRIILTELHHLVLYVNCKSMFSKNVFSKTHRGSWIKHEVFHKKTRF